MTKEQLKQMNHINEAFNIECSRIVDDWFSKINPMYICADTFYYVEETNRIECMGKYILFFNESIDIEFSFDANLLFMSNEELEKYFSNYKSDINYDERLSSIIKERMENIMEEYKELEEIQKIMQKI